MPMFGYVAVQHAQMDHAVDGMICHLAGTTAAAGAAITSAVINLSTRLDIMRRLTITTVTDEDDQDKLFSINFRASELSGQRNRIMHDRGYSYSPSADTVALFRSENLTSPQIKRQPPTEMTIDFLRSLGDEMFQVMVWLGIYYPTFPDCKHPKWNDDAQIPWPDKLDAQLQKRRRDQD